MDGAMWHETSTRCHASRSVKQFTKFDIDDLSNGSVGMNPSGILNSLAPEKFELMFRYVIFKQILGIDGWSISCEIALIWMSLGLH